MKYNFSAMQVLNWLFVSKKNLQKLSEEQNTKEELKKKINVQKKNLLLIKDVLNRKTKLSGVNPDFLRNFKQIKKDYGIED